MAARRTRKTDVVTDTVPPVEEIEETTTMSDDVYEPETESAEAPAKAKPGRKADPLTAAVKELREAKSALDLARSAPSVPDAEARHEAAKSAVESLVASL